MTAAVVADTSATRSPLPPPHHGGDGTHEQLLAALPSAVGSAQRFVRHTLEQWQLDHLAETGEAVVATLVGDAVARTGVTVEHPGYADLYGKPLNLLAVRVRTLDDRVLLEVHDGDATPPWTREPTTPVTHPARRTPGVRAVNYDMGSTGGTIARVELNSTRASGLPQRIRARRPAPPSDPPVNIERDPNVLQRVLSGLEQMSFSKLAVPR